MSRRWFVLLDGETQVNVMLHGSGQSRLTYSLIGDPLTSDADDVVFFVRDGSYENLGSAAEPYYLTEGYMFSRVLRQIHHEMTTDQKSEALPRMIEALDKSAGRKPANASPSPVPERYRTRPHSCKSSGHPARSTVLSCDGR
jgi:hypothetical protein